MDLPNWKKKSMAKVGTDAADFKLKDLATQAHSERGTRCLFGQESSLFPSWVQAPSLVPDGPICC